MKKRYEAVYLLVDTLKEDAIAAACENVRADIRKFGGTVVGEKPVERRAFARPLQKQLGGHSLEVALDLEPDKVGELKQRHKLDPNVFRVMIVSAVSKPAAGRPAKEAGAGQGPAVTA